MTKEYIDKYNLIISQESTQEEFAIAHKLFAVIYTKYKVGKSSIRSEVPRKREPVLMYAFVVVMHKLFPDIQKHVLGAFMYKEEKEISEILHQYKNSNIASMDIVHMAVKELEWRMLNYNKKIVSDDMAKRVSRTQIRLICKSIGIEMEKTNALVSKIFN
ncbi:MAG: hypothetical protein R3B64_00080 [Candidatus Paceibacterota bacterium]